MISLDTLYLFHNLNEIKDKIQLKIQLSWQPVTQLTQYFQKRRFKFTILKGGWGTDTKCNKLSRFLSKDSVKNYVEI